MNKKPTFRTFYAKNIKWLLAFILGTNLLFYTLFRMNRFDLQSFQIWFWISVTVFSVSIIGSLIHYNKTFKR